MVCLKIIFGFRKTGNNITINKRTIPSFNVPCYGTEFTFQSNSEYTGAERLPVRSVKGATDLLKNTLSCDQDISLISFEGVLVERKFLDPFSKPIKISNSNVFGTPGKTIPTKIKIYLRKKKPIAVVFACNTFKMLFIFEGCRKTIDKVIFKL